MKFTSRITKLLSVFLVLCVVLTGCQKQGALKDPYSVFDTKLTVQSEQANAPQFIASGLCVPSGNQVAEESLQQPYVEAAGLFDVTAQTVPYCKNVYGKMYPASTTKILTALLILENCKLDEVVTVSENATKLPSGAVGCKLKTGDQITVEQLLYGLLLVSGNDCAVALAEHLSQTVEGFATKMNEKCKMLGATHSNFVNPNGLHDDNHYSSVYDLYLIFQECIKNPEFVKIINSPTYKATYKDSTGAVVENMYETTNMFLNGKETVPGGISIIGGKTGTTNDAGSCLVLYCKNKKGNDQILIVLKAGSKELLYQHMRKMMEEFSNL